MFRLPQDIIELIIPLVDVLSLSRFVATIATDHRFECVAKVIQLQTYSIAIRRGYQGIIDSESGLCFNQCLEVINTLNNVNVDIKMTAYDYSPVSDFIGKVQDKVARFTFHLEASDQINTVSIPTPFIHHKITRLDLVHEDLSQKNLDTIINDLTNLKALTLETMSDLVVDIPFDSTLTEISISSKMVTLLLLPSQLKKLKLANCALDSHCPTYNLLHLHLHNVLGGTDFVLSLVLQSNKSLKQLYCDGDYIDIPAIRIVWEILMFEAKLFNQLQVLSLRGTHNFCHVMDYPSLTTLGIELSCGYTDEHVIDESTLSRDCNLIQRLTNLSSLTIHSIDTNLIKHLKLPPQLHSLRMNELIVLDEFLDERQDSIFSLDGMDFHNIKNLTINYFGIDNISNIPNSIEFLDLSHNKFLCVPPNLDNCTALKTLLLRNNYISFAQISAPNLVTIDLSSNLVKQVVLPYSIENINLQNNWLDSINEIFDWETYEKKQASVLSNSNNHLCSFKNLETINIGRNRISKIDRLTLPEKLTLLQLFPSDKLTSFQNIVWNECITKVSLGMWFNEYRSPPEISHNLFEKLKNLEILMISGLPITTTEQNPLYLPTALRSFRLNKNCSKEIHLQFPKGETCIQAISLSGCKNESQYSKYSFFSLGHNKNGSFLNNLEYIEADVPPSDEFEEYPPNFVYIKLEKDFESQVSDFIFNPKFASGIDLYKMEDF